MGLIPSTDAHDFLKEVKNYDPNSGTILDWSDHKYYNDNTYLTNTMCGHLEDSPEHLDSYLNYPAWREDKQAYIDGRALHSMVLEGPNVFNKQFWYIDDRQKCDDIGGAKPRSTKVYKEWKNELELENKDKQFISYSWYYDITMITAKINKLPQTRQLLENTKKEIIYSKTLDNIPCKCKVDAINVGNYLIDLKSSKDCPNQRNFERTLYRYNYLRQAAFYCDITGIKQFWFIVVEKTFPFTVGVYEISEDKLNEGRLQYQNLLKIYQANNAQYNKKPEMIDNFLYFGKI